MYITSKFSVLPNDKIDSAMTTFKAMSPYIVDNVITIHTEMCRKLMRLKSKHLGYDVVLEYWADDKRKVIRWDYYIRNKTQPRDEKNYRYTYHPKKGLLDVAD